MGSFGKFARSSCSRSNFLDGSTVSALGLGLIAEEQGPRIGETGQAVEAVVVIVAHRAVLPLTQSLHIDIPVVVVEGDLSALPLTAGVDLGGTKIQVVVTRAKRVVGSASRPAVAGRTVTAPSCLCASAFVPFVLSRLNARAAPHLLRRRSSGTSWVGR